MKCLNTLLLAFVMICQPQKVGPKHLICLTFIPITGTQAGIYRVGSVYTAVMTADSFRHIQASFNLANSGTRSREAITAWASAWAAQSHLAHGVISQVASLQEAQATAPAPKRDRLMRALRRLQGRQTLSPPAESLSWELHNLPVKALSLKWKAVLFCSHSTLYSIEQALDKVICG